MILEPLRPIDSALGAEAEVRVVETIPAVVVAVAVVKEDQCECLAVVEQN